MDESRARSRHPDSIEQTFVWALVSSMVLFLITPAVGDAQQVVMTNITPSALPACPGPCGAGVTSVSPLPPAQGGTITITGGARPGNGPNLFHSFGQFDVGAGDIANFQNTQVNGAFPATSNILSRVTGGNQSQIYGTIQTTDFPGANLFLMNPAGVLFGPSAALDLGAVTGSAVRQPGSFYATMADYLNLGDADGTSPFYADPAKASVLSVAPVAAFGFLALEPGATRGTISVQGSNLQVPKGQSLSLVGGDITVQSGTLENGTIQAASLHAPGGQLNLVSVASPGEVLVPNFQTGSFTTTGTVTLKEGASLNVSGQLEVDAQGNPIGGNSGTVFVRGGQLVMEASEIQAITVGAVDGARTAVDIQVSQDVALSQGALIFTGTSGPGRGGDVHITANSLTLENGSRITTATSGLGLVGGDLFLNVGTLRLLGGSRIRSTNTAGTDLDGDEIVDVTGVGGNVTVQGATQGAGSAAEKVELSGGSRIESETRLLGGDGGQIYIRAKSLNLEEASRINSLTSVTGIDLNGDGAVDTGRGGGIVVAVQHLKVVGGAAIASSTGSIEQGAADGGTVTVQGLDGPGSNSVMLSGQNTGIFSDSALGLPGDLIVNAGTLTVTNGAVISAGSSQSDGPAGKVTVTADSIVISAEGQIFSRSFAQESGQVTITADALTLDNGSIDTSTSSETGGRAGDVVLHGGTVSLTNGASIKSQSGSETDSGKFSTGRAGDITITGESLTLANHSEITSSSHGIEAHAGDAGNITIHSGSTVAMNNSSITTEARQASGGQIVITAPEMVRLINHSEVSTSVADGTGGGGNIMIDPQFVILQNSTISANAFGGSGGAINVIAGVFLADPNSVVEATSQQGPQGTVNIQSPVKNLGEQLTPLSQQFSSAAALLAQRCAARVADGKFSTFVVAGREGLPVEPGGFLASPSFTAELLGASLSGLYPPTPIAAITGSFPEYDARPIQLAKYGDACH